jgi:hypothetical protein
MKAFGYLFAGSCEFVKEPKHFDRLDNLITEFVFAVQSVVLDSLDLEISEILVQTLIEILDSLIEK